MATYLIGDIHGCFHTFQHLLESINYKPDVDTLWSCGDLVSKGPDSDQVLDFWYRCEKKVVVLGNHDLYLLAVAAGQADPSKSQAWLNIQKHKHASTWLHWLRQQPLLHVDPQNNIMMVHAGLWPNWSLAEACWYANLCHQHLAGPRADFFLKHMIGPAPKTPNPQDDESMYFRALINVFTRMRCINENNELDFDYTGTLDDMPDTLRPWYRCPHRRPHDIKIAFGHWAALKAASGDDDVYALDGGCAWGGELVALRLEDRKRFAVPNQEN